MRRSSDNSDIRVVDVREFSRVNGRSRSNFENTGRTNSQVIVEGSPEVTEDESFRWWSRRRWGLPHSVTFCGESILDLTDPLDRQFSELLSDRRIFRLYLTSDQIRSGGRRLLWGWAFLIKGRSNQGGDLRARGEFTPCCFRPLSAITMRPTARKPAKAPAVLERFFSDGAAVVRMSL